MPNGILFAPGSQENYHRLIKTDRSIRYKEKESKKKQSQNHSTIMKRIAFAFASLGTVFAVLAQYAYTNDWSWFNVFHTMGFIGYILIISAITYFSLVFIHQLSREEKIRMRNRGIDRA
jgi:polyferredoxin